MVDEPEIILQFWQDRRTQARQSENQRATLTNLVLLIESAALGFIANRGLEPEMLALTITLILLGVYGAVGVLKLYERHQLHATEAREIAKRLDELNPKLHIRGALRTAKQAHVRAHPILSRLRLHDVWAFLHFAVAIIGLVLTIVILT